jgi:hypothetical protein
MRWVALKRTTLLDETIKLPRPKMTQEVLLVGERDKCFDVINKLITLPENQSTDIIDVELVVVKYTGQITYNSKSIHRDNGKRNISR